MLRFCNKCKENKSEELFSKCNSFKDGLQKYCKDCMKAYRERSSEYTKARKKEYHIKNRDKKSEYDKKRYALKRDEIIRKQKEYYLKNKDKIINKVNEYYKTDIGKLSKRNVKLRRRSIMKKSNLSASDLNVILSSSSNCYWCNVKFSKDIKKEIDHYVPLSKGGLHDKYNIVVSCSLCNKTKSAKDPSVFANEIGKLL